jgi:hypothetical protein
MTEKKSYVKCEAYNTEIKPDTSDKSIMVIKGVNSKGSPMEITVSIDDYFFSYMVKDMAKIARKRVEVAKSRLTQLVQSVNENQSL